ncbi:hypothetical protein SAMN02910417_01185 [Eubacterium oxidoreducens]|uniref:Uncharacterized protein n=1 Tax=Eubacterium oxidoreducens TaxID=1732 RepID=A0A1G6B534_EUBOX|nr:hypothetical protein SAMN02910417_01185 [Eubacterium oxidoreducens]
MYTQSGAIKKVNTASYSDGAKDYSSNMKYTYKKKGKTVTATGKIYVGKSYQGKEVVKSTYYDKSLKHVKKTVRKVYDSSNNLITKYIYTYTKKGVEKSYAYYVEGELLTKESYNFNKKGKRTDGTVTEYDANGTATEYQLKYSYKKGYTYETIMNSDGTVHSKSKYKTDAAGVDVYLYKTDYSYSSDESGNVTYSEVKYTYKNTYYKKGVSKGCLKTTIAYVNGEKKIKTTYKYK